MKEEGSAQIILDLTNSKITMRHSDGTLLKSWAATSGDWDKLYHNICYNTFDDNQNTYSKSVDGTFYDAPSNSSPRYD